MSKSQSTPTAGKATPEPDLSGRRLGDYQLLRRLGRGGMADVYLAEQRTLSRKVAFKVLKRSLSGDATYVKRFLKEARAAAALSHPGIVQIYEVGCIEGVHFMAQEYVPGQNLAELLKRTGPIEPPQAISIMRQVGAALYKAAEHGVVHRDIKPDNIMLSKSGEVKVADFGLARVADDVGLTQAGVTMGTPLYMSPEQVEGKDLDNRSDLYSFGVTCYHMLAGHPPFDGETALAVAVHHLNTEPPRLEELRSDLPEGLCRIVHRLMAKSIDDRFQTAPSMLKELRTLQIDGAEDGDWPSFIDGWSSSELKAVAAARHGATQQLASVMKEARAKKSNVTWVWMSLCCAAACILGGVVAWANRPESLLNYDPAQVAQVERHATAQDQYYFATLVGTEEALRSVARYFPPSEGSDNQYYTRRSQQRLAELYTETGRLNQAATIFTDLANLSPTEAEFRAYGVAGQAMVYDQQGKTELASEKLRELLPLRRRLSGAMEQEAERLFKKYEKS